MAIAMRGRSCAADDKPFIDRSQVLAAGAHWLRQGSDALAQAIDWSLTVAFLLTDLALAASLAATAAAFASSPPH